MLMGFKKKNKNKKTVTKSKLLHERDRIDENNCQKQINKYHYISHLILLYNLRPMLVIIFAI